MAKKFGLGAGVDALMGKAGLSAEDFIPNHAEEAAQAVTKAVEAGNIPEEVASGQRKLPEGINVDENGQLWLSVDLLKPNPISLERNLRKKPLTSLLTQSGNTESYRPLPLKTRVTEISTSLRVSAEHELQKSRILPKFRFSCANTLTRKNLKSLLSKIFSAKT